MCRDTEDRLNNLSDELLTLTLQRNSNAVAEKLFFVHFDNVKVLGLVPNEEKKTVSGSDVGSVVETAYQRAIKNKYNVIGTQLFRDDGLSDLLFYPPKEQSNPPILFGLMAASSANAQTALDIVKDLHKKGTYDCWIGGYNGQVLYVGIVFDSEKQAYECRIE